MRFSCSRGEFLRGIQIAVRTIPGRPTSLQILKNVLIEAAGDTVTLTCYDQEVGMQVRVSAQVEIEGETTAPAKLLAEVIADLPEAPISLASDESHNMTVSCQQTEYNLAGLSADDFPRLPEVGSETRVVLKAALLREIIRQTIFAVAVEESRPALTGLYFSLGDGKVVAVATDTHRLSIREAMAPDVEGQDQVILPGRAMDQFTRAIPADATDDVEVRVSRNQAMIHCRDITVVSRLIEGPYPHYERVLPSAYEKLLLVEREAFTKAVKRVAIVARYAPKANRMVMHTADGMVHLLADISGVGTAHEVVPVELQGDDVEMAFDCTYLLDVLGVLTGQTLRLEVSGTLTPCVIRSEADPGYRYIVMPMQIV